MSDIVINGLSKSFGEKKALENFSYTFKSGKITCIEGASGCGKTTLLKIIAGLMPADSGSIEGVPEKISFVFQEDRLCEDFSAVSNIKLACGKSVKKETALHHLGELDLLHEANKAVKDLSGGMKRRVAIARAVCYDADLVILDEPFKGLDEQLKKNVMDYVLKYTFKKTVIIVTHDQDEIAYLADQTLTMQKQK